MNKKEQKQEQSIAQAVSAVKVFEEVSAESRQQLEKLLQQKHCPRGTMLFSDRDCVDVFYFLAEGYVSLYKIGREGEKKIIFVCSGGEMLNEVMIQEDHASVSAQALTDCVLLTADRAAFQHLMASDYCLAEAVMRSMAVKIRRLYHQLKNTPGSVNLDRQLRAKLWKLAKDHGVPREEGIEIDFDLSRSFLAEMVGAKRETVSRQMNRLAGEGVIRICKKRILIPDPEKLIDFMVKRDGNHG